MKHSVLVWIATVVCLGEYCSELQLSWLQKHQMMKPSHALYSLLSMTQALTSEPVQALYSLLSMTKALTSEPIQVLYSLLSKTKALTSETIRRPFTDCQA